MGDPFGDHDVGLVDPGGAVRVHKLAWDELVFGLTAEVCWVTIAELGDRLVVDAKNGDTAFEVGDQHQAAVEVDVARHAHSFGDEAFVLAVEIEDLESAVASVGDDELRLARGALVDPESVGAADLTGSVSGTDDGSDEDAVFGELVDVATAVAVSDEDVAGRKERDVGGVPAVAVAVLAGLLGVVEFPDDAAIEVGFGDNSAVDVADVEELFPSLFAEVEAVSSAGPFGAEGLDELPFRVEDADGVAADAS